MTDSPRQTPTDLLSDIALGMMTLNEWELEGAALNHWIHRCLELGVTTFDHADLYGDYSNEERFGLALKAEPGLRDKLQIVTKCGVMKVSGERPDNRFKHYDSSRKHLLGSVEHSLGLFGTDRIDLFLVHRPDLLMDMTELGRTLDDLIDSGKILEAGVSNFTPSQFRALQAHMRHRLATNQVRFNLLHTEPLFDGTVDLASELGFRLMAYAPFESGRLRRQGDPESDAIRAAAERISSCYPFSANGVPVSWITSHPTRPHVVVATKHLDRIEDMVAATRHPLDRQHWYELLQLSRGVPVP